MEANTFLCHQYYITRISKKKHAKYNWLSFLKPRSNKMKLSSWQPWKDSKKNRKFAKCVCITFLLYIKQEICHTKVELNAILLFIFAILPGFPRCCWSMKRISCLINQLFCWILIIIRLPKKCNSCWFHNYHCNVHSFSYTRKKKMKTVQTFKRFVIRIPYVLFNIYFLKFLFFFNSLNCSHFASFFIIHSI